MKSIKEKAREVQIGYDDVQAPAVGSGFVLGANYVLEQIEKTYDKEGFLGVLDLIKQLKK